MNYRRLSHVADQISARSAVLFTSTAPGPQRPRWSVAALVALVLIAAVLRFWGVGSFSLHKPDEDTTALAAVHILQDGTPRFPNGMFYARAIAQSYMIAASVKAFGQTEWALRLPSVLCGLLVVVLAYWMGRRFLDPVWNLTFAACVAFLPMMIADSQEARMYVFMIASLAAYAGFVFEWERSGRPIMLAAAVGAMLVGIQFHQLVIFGSLMVLFPGLLQGDGKKLRQAVMALAAIGVGYVAISRWTASFYPSVAVGYADPMPQLGQAPSSFGARLAPLSSAALAVWAVLLASLTIRGMQLGRSTRIVIAALVLLGLLSQALLYYHLALLLLVLAGVLIRRQNALTWGRIALLAAATGAMLAAHVYMLYGAGVDSPRKMIGILVGKPSIWQYVRAGEYSWVAAAIVALGLARALWQVANRRTIPDYWLFFLLVGWVPLLAMGMFGWYFPPRYTEFALLPVLLTAVACCQQWVSTLPAVRSLASPASRCALAAVACVAIVNPWAVARSVNAGESFADHKSAARFVQSRHLGPNDIVVAEEVLMQTYYLGHVDYWLQVPSYAAAFVTRVGDRFVDEYTATPVIGTAAGLQQLLMQSDRGAIYVIGSGDQDDGEQPRRGPEIDRVLRSGEFKVVYIARDGRTKVWMADAPAASAVQNR